MPTRADVAGASRDSVLTLRRVERQQHLVERLCTAPRRVTLRELADELGVTGRTVSRDIRRLRESGVPVVVTPGRGGGASLRAPGRVVPLTLDVPEVAALLASLVALGPTASDSAASAVRKLVEALAPQAPTTSR